MLYKVVNVDCGLAQDCLGEDGLVTLYTDEQDAQDVVDKVNEAMAGVLENHWAVKPVDTMATAIELDLWFVNHILGLDG
jgi:ribosome-associated toxin RatA of RatAB toxin-antitoxin module